MELGLINETKEHEKAWNAFRFALTAKKQAHEVKAFPMGEDVECRDLRHARYDVAAQFEAFVATGGEVLACGTCLKSRAMDGTETCPTSTMVDCVNLVAWADPVVTF